MSVPIVSRYNPWGQWRPICGVGPLAQFERIQRTTRAIPLPAAAAVNAYCAYTGFLGIEFVVLAGWPDGAPFRPLPSGMLLVPCSACHDNETGALPPWWLYDGWMPIESSSLEAILAGLGRIDETVSLLAYEFGLSARSVVKYVETVRIPRTYRDLDSSHFAEAEALSAHLDGLPQRLRAATARAIHWFQQAQLANTMSQRFLLFYFALETLVLTLWEDGREIGLPLPDMGSESKADQRARRNEAILSDMEAGLGRDPSGAVTEAYFKHIVGIARRTRKVLRALAGPDSDFPEWLFQKNDTGLSPASLRADLVHGRRHEADPAVIESLTSFLPRIENAIKVSIARILERRWSGISIKAKSQSYVAHFPVVDTMMWSESGSPAVVGDFTIDLDLLGSKGLL